MINDIYIKKNLAKNWFLLLRDMICYEFEKIENDYGKKNKKRGKFFITKNWKKSINNDEGGGTYKIISNGLVFEKVGVNYSAVSGKFKSKFNNEIPGAKKNSNFFATGISVVAHMKNPKIPALHFNTRFIVTSHSWFGGGIDATPCLNDIDEKKNFHNILKKTCKKHNKNYYSKYKKWCDEYFYLNHRREKRGIGGIFFDYKRKNWKRDFNFIQDVGLCFLKLSKSIIRKKMYKKWTIKQKNIQLLKRGRYVEFNLLYDRGTKFGLNTGGNTEAILISLPPIVKWN